MQKSAISSTAAATVAAFPSTTGSPQPTRPDSVVTLRKHQRGAIRNVSRERIFMEEDWGLRRGDDYAERIPAIRFAAVDGEFDRRGLRLRLHDAERHLHLPGETL